MEPDQKYPAQSLKLQVRQVTYQATGVNSYELVHPDGDDLPPFTAGAHIDFYFRDGSVRQYSLCNDPGERKRYLIAVLREANGRGGSQALHERVHVQRKVFVGAPRNNFPIQQDARKHVLLAGGIGVTPMMAMAAALESAGADYVMHYCTKAPEYTAFRPALAPLSASGKVFVHHDGGDPRNGLDIAGVLRDHEPGTHLYYCGPAGFMRAAMAAAKHWPDGTVHFEYFTAAAAPKSTLTDAERSEVDDGAVGIGFQIEIASTGATYFVPNHKTIVQVLEEHGVAVEVSCQSGLCGTCTTRYTAGEVDHQDLVLGQDQRSEFLTICCSRAKSKLLVLDL